MPNILIPDIGAAIKQSIFGAGNTFNDPTRIPMSFTSTRRLRALNSKFAGQISDFQQIFDPKRGFGISTNNPTISSELPIITMLVNPNTITWKQPKRLVKRDTREGSVYFHFTNSKGENNDILTLDFRGNTGNIDPRGDAQANDSAFSTQSNSTGTGAINKQIVWHNLWALTREQMLLDDNTINTFQIIYSSPIMPIQISLLGFFGGVLEWTDSADKPFSKDYGFSFTVQETIPPLNDLVNEIATAAFDPAEIQTA